MYGHRYDTRCWYVRVTEGEGDHWREVDVPQKVRYELRWESLLGEGLQVSGPLLKTNTSFLRYFCDGKKN